MRGVSSTVSQSLPPSISIFHVITARRQLPPLPVESPQACWVALQRGSRSLFVAGQGPLVRRLTLDPLCRSYTWEPSLPPAAGNSSELSDICRLLWISDESYSEREMLLLGMSHRGSAAVWNVATNQLVSLVDGNPEAGMPRNVSLVSFKRGPGTLASQSATDCAPLALGVLTRQERRLQVWQPRSGTWRATNLLPAQNGFLLTTMLVCPALQSKEDHLILAGTADGSVLAWWLATGDILGALSGISTTAVMSIALHEQSECIASQNDEPHILSFLISIGWACGTALTLSLSELIKAIESASLIANNE